MFRYKDKLYATLQVPEIKNIAEMKDFYFQKAKDKFEELQETDTVNINLPALIKATKQSPFSFETWLNSYSNDSAEYKLLLLIGQIISYCDSKAAMKNALNEYDDKRVIASAYVRQNYWVEYLLRFKSGLTIHELPQNIRNAILCIQNPENNISIVSEERKKLILDKLFENSDGDLFEEMKKTGIAAENPLNSGILYTMILHDYSIKSLWSSPTEHVSYWLGGAAFSGGTEDLSTSFIENSIFAIGFTNEDISGIVTNHLSLNNWIANIEDTNARKAFELFSQMKVGDKIAIKSSFAKDKSSLLRIKAIGTILDSLESGYSYSEKCKHTIPVKWMPVIPAIDYKLGGYWKTIHKVTKKEDIDTIFGLDSGKQNLDVPILDSKYNKHNFLSEVYMTPERYEDIIELLNRKKNIILQGAPGVGKSYLAKRLTYSIIGVKDENRVEMVQFHQSYSYEDFIEGYRPDGKGGFMVKKGVFYKFCKKARDINGNCYFIIDEINRGNLSKIMGELMLLIENDKRGEKFTMPLTYSNEQFYVPENVYIVGMMNTADRSLAMIDYALRRRFSFVPVDPAFANPKFIKYIKKDDEVLGEKILKEMTDLNIDIKNDLGAGFQIGHSFFCNCENINEQWYKNVLKYDILPLLEEYWFDNEKQRSKWMKRLSTDEKNSN